MTIIKLMLTEQETDRLKTALSMAINKMNDLPDTKLIKTWKIIKTKIQEAELLV